MMRSRAVRLAVAGTLLALLAVAPRARAGGRESLDAARLAAETRRWAAADSLATAALESFAHERRADSLLVAEAWERIAESQWMRRRLGDGAGLAHAERALGVRRRHAPRDTMALVRLHTLAGRLAREREDGDRGLTHAKAALDLALAAGDSALADRWSLLGTAHQARGERGEAVRALTEAVAVAARRFGDDDPRTARHRVDLGMVLTDDVQAERARLELRRAIAALEPHEAAYAGELAAALSNMARLERGEGRLAEAVDAMRRSYELSRRTQGANSATTLRAQLNLSFQLVLLGDERGAVRLMEDAIPAFAARMGDTHAQVLRVRLAYANALTNLGDTARAFVELDSVRAIIDRHPDRPYAERGFERTLRALLYNGLGRHREASALLSTVWAGESERTDPTGGRRGEVLSTWLETVRSAADSAALDTLLRQADSLEASSPVRGTPTGPLLMASRARAEGRAGRDDDAWRDALAAEALAHERFQLNVRTLSDRQALGLQEIVGQPLDLVLAFAREAPRGELRTAWDRLVRWRGMVREEVTARRPPSGADTGRAAIHAAWVEAQRRWAKQVVEGGGDDASRAALDSARVQAEEAERRWRRAAADLAPPEPATLDAVLARLQPGEGLAAFAEIAPGQDRARLAVFVADGARREPRRIVLGASEDLRAAVHAWRSAIERSPARDTRGAAAAERDARRLGADVRARLWEPVRRLAPEVRRWHVVGDGAAHDLPWGALPEGTARYLAESAVDIRPIEAERDLLRDAPPAAAGGLLAVGDPAFEAAPDGTRTGPLAFAASRTAATECARTRPFALEPLPAAREEARDVAHGWSVAARGPARVLVGPEATESAFRAEAPGRRVIHLATHGVVVEDSCLAAGRGTRGVGGVEPVATKPARRRPAPPPAPAPVSIPPRQVWLAFAGAAAPPTAAEPDDGLLTAEEAATLDLRGTDWVVLSACHSGSGDTWPREGTLGMRRAFRLAGVRAVIASGWSVDDASTREWMLALYAARERGEDRASGAVRAANREVIEARRRSGRTTHPFYWAGFTASGD